MTKCDSLVLKLARVGYACQEELRNRQVKQTAYDIMLCLQRHNPSPGKMPYLGNFLYLLKLKKGLQNALRQS